MNTTGPETPPRAANPTSQPYALLPYQPPAALVQLKAFGPWSWSMALLLPHLAPCPLWLGPGLAPVGGCAFLFSSPKLPDLNCAGSTARRSKLSLSRECLSDELSTRIGRTGEALENFPPANRTLRFLPKVLSCSLRMDKIRDTGRPSCSGRMHACTQQMHLVSASNTAKKRIPRC